MPHSTTSTVPSPPPRGVCEPQPFYGWRYLRSVGEDGVEHLTEIPLTLEDVLHPQEGDVIPENSLHGDERGYLHNVFKSRVGRLHRGRIFSDCIINWGVAGVGNHSPDLSVFEGVVDLDRIWGIFPMRAESATCVLALELVSPDTRVNDLTFKLEEYHRVGVPLYVVVDQKKLGGPRTLLGYRWAPDGYVSLRLDRQGRLLLPPVGLLLGLVDDRLVCYDAATGEAIGDYAEVAAARVAAEEARQQEAAARAAAEAERQQEAAARVAAEEARQQEAAARAAAEARVRELEELLCRLGGPNG